MTDSQSPENPSLFTFWGCFIALITTAFAFITRAFMCNTPDMWPRDFGLDTVQAGTLFGHGLWSFSISIILFSLVIDRIGYRTAMFFSVMCYAIYAAFALYAHSIVKAPGLDGQALLEAQAKGLNFLTIGSIILGLGNGTVEAFINPVVATLFNKEKTKWLNILHAGWPGGLVIGGLITLGFGKAAQEDWRLLVYIIAIPAIVYLVMLAKAKFPVSERVSMGATYSEMLGEFGVIGAAIALFLIFRNLGGTFDWPSWAVYAPIVVGTIAYGVYCKSLGRPMMIFLCLIMMPLATTELGTDGAITGIMEEPMKLAGYSALWVLIYTSAIMMVLRFFAGPIVKALTPLGLLATCATLAILGLYSLSIVKGTAMIFAAATLYGIGKTFFWPTMLGVVAEQFPKGGALTLNAISGIGMLAVGVLGNPLIGYMQEQSAKAAIVKEVPGVYETVSKKANYFLGEYEAVDADKVAKLEGENKTRVDDLAKGAKQSSLAKITVFPMFMLVCYLILIGYFKSKGGYRPQTMDGQPASAH
jgi:MFS family permease